MDRMEPRFLVLPLLSSAVLVLILLLTTQTHKNRGVEPPTTTTPATTTVARIAPPLHVANPRERRRRRQQDEEEEIGPVCMGHGKWYGRNFNRLISFAHVVQEAKNRNTYVRLYQGDSRFSWYGEWLIDFQNATIFDPVAAAHGIPRIMQKNNDPRRKELNCSLDMEVKNWYYWNFDNDQQRQDLTNNFFGTEDPSVMIRSLDPSLELVLPLLQPGFAEDAAKQLHSYRSMHLANLLQRHQNRKEITINDIRTVTVHSRTLEGGCGPTIDVGHTFCEPKPAANPTRLETWKESCHFTQGFVQSQLPPSYSIDTTVIILFGDGQSKDTENTFTWKDTSSFGVQAAMMAQSDFHFGNPASSVDKVVAHWRKGRPIFPDDCFAEIVDHYQSIITDDTQGQSDVNNQHGAVGAVLGLSALLVAAGVSIVHYFQYQTDTQGPGRTGEVELQPLTNADDDEW